MFNPHSLDVSLFRCFIEILKIFEWKLKRTKIFHRFSLITQAFHFFLLLDSPCFLLFRMNVGVLEFVFLVDDSKNYNFEQLKKALRLLHEHTKLLYFYNKNKLQFDSTRRKLFGSVLVVIEEEKKNIYIHMKNESELCLCGFLFLWNNCVNWLFRRNVTKPRLSFFKNKNQCN